MPKIEVLNKDRVIDCAKGSSLLQALLQAHIFVDNPCNGRGLCGKCRVRHLAGGLPSPSSLEEKLLTEEELKSGIRLACQIYPVKDAGIEVLTESRRAEVLEEGRMPEFDFCPAVIKRSVVLTKPTLEQQISFEKAVEKAFDIEEIPLEVLLNSGSAQSSWMKGEEVTAVFYGDKLIGLEKGDTRGRLYGAAVDLGTTTIAALLINLNTGEWTAKASAVNPQTEFGHDVLTRITFANEHKEGKDKLQKAAADALNLLIGELCETAGIQKEWIYEITAAANTTMIHMLTGSDAGTIGRSPYVPLFTGIQHLKAAEFGLNAAPGAVLTCLPGSSSYIGADIVAGVCVCELYREKRNVLLLDIGTNGEFVLSKKGQLLSCSCAAGPALEGMNISAGMRAAEGAVEQVTISPEGIRCQVIGNTVPQGLCGSGILSAANEMLRTGMIRPDGGFLKREELPEGDYRKPWLFVENRKRSLKLTGEDREVSVTQGDIRQLQLAKGALLSGFKMLLKKAGLRPEELEEVFIAGQFGAHISPADLVGAGIVPEEVKDKITYVGNTSLTGACMALMSREAAGRMERAAEQIGYIELGALEGYESCFVECCNFPGHQEA